MSKYRIILIDDATLSSDSAKGLQRNVNVVAAACERGSVALY